MTELTDAIRSRGHWNIAIRPEDFQESRVSYGNLGPIIERAVVRLRGWPLPFIEYREDFIREDEWIGQDISPGIHQPEAWRFYTSGQFTHLSGLVADWRADDLGIRVPDGAQSIVAVWEILFFITEVFELAGRLALGPAGDERMVVEVGLNGLRHRALVVAQRNRAEFFAPRVTHMEAIERSVTLTRDELVAEPRAHAVALAQEIFLRFGFDASLNQLAEHQAEIDR